MPAKAKSHAKKSQAKKHHKKTVYVPVSKDAIASTAKSNEPTAFGSILKAGGSALGGLLGSSSMGGYVGNAISKLLGQGDYVMNDVKQLEENSIVKPSYGDLTHMKYNKDGTFRIRHREFLGDISGSTTFVNNRYEINPGNTRTFPYLYKIAQQFQTYEVEGMCFEFISTSSDALNSTNTALGTVIMGVQYDTIDRPFQNKIEAENTQGTISGKPSTNLVMCVECKPGNNVLRDLYIVRPGQTSPYDPRFQNLGAFQIMTVGMQAGVTLIGELWCDYDITCKKPILGLASASALLTHYSLDNTITDSTSTSLFFGTSPAALQNDFGVSITLPINQVIISNQSFTTLVAPIRIRVDYQITGVDSAAPLRYMDIAYTNATPYNFYTYDNNVNSVDTLSNGFAIGAQFFQTHAFEVIDIDLPVVITYSGPTVFPASGIVEISGDYCISLIE